MSLKSQWIGAEGAAFDRVGMVFERLGFRAPRADGGSNGTGAYASNIVAQYAADLSERQALAIIRYGLKSSRESLRNNSASLNEIAGWYGE